MATEEPAFWRTFYRWTRDVHLYVGLLVSPVILVFALSAIFLNHAFLPWTADARLERSAHVTLGSSDNSLDLAKQVRSQLGIPGEIDFIQMNTKTQHLSFPIRRPGWSAKVDVEMSTGAVRIREKRTGIWDAMVYMHKMPGPHNVALRGNWLQTRLWGWMSDATVYLILFLTATGIYMWTILRAERRVGMVFLGSGMLSFVLILLAVTR